MYRKITWWLVCHCYAVMFIEHVDVCTSMQCSYGKLCSSLLPIMGLGQQALQLQYLRHTVFNSYWCLNKWHKQCIS